MLYSLYMCVYPYIQEQLSTDIVPDLKMKHGIIPMIPTISET